MKKMSLALKHLPDYYADGYVVEVMGLGRDGVLKLKVEKYEGLKVWNRLQPLALFVWNSHEREYAVIHWEALKRLVGKARKAGLESFKNDGNEYYPIRWEWMNKAGAFVGSYEVEDDG